MMKYRNWEKRDSKAKSANQIISFNFPFFQSVETGLNTSINIFNRNVKNLVSSMYELHIIFNF